MKTPSLAVAAALALTGCGHLAPFDPQRLRVVCTTEGSNRTADAACVVEYGR